MMMMCLGRSRGEIVLISADYDRFGIAAVPREALLTRAILVFPSHFVFILFEHSRLFETKNSLIYNF